MEYDKTQLLAAVNNLILDASPRYKLDALDAVAALNRNFPCCLSGELEVLNPLLDLRLHNAEKYASVQGLIDMKREIAGYEPLWPPEAPRKFDKTEYQRSLMALRRARSGRAVNLENLQRPESEKIIGIDRLEFERRQLANWGAQCKALIEAQRKAHGGSLTKDQTDLIRMRFWENLEESLDQREADIKRELLKPAHQRRKI